MIGKWIGAILIMAACGGFGFSLAYRHLRDERLLRQILRILEQIDCELQCHLKPLPEICRQIASEEKGLLGGIFLRLAIEMENQILPDAQRCMEAAVKSAEQIPNVVQQVLYMLGKQLGRYDLHGQLKGIDGVRRFVRRKINELDRDKDTRIRSYKTLALCAGAALVILFI